MGIKSIAKRAAGKAGNAVAKLSALSPEQLREVDERRQRYLSEMPSADDATAVELTSRLIAAAGVEIYNAYLPQIAGMYVPVEADAEYEGASFNARYNVRFLNVTKWVSDPEENSLEKLVNVYEVLSSEECNIALVFHRGRRKTDVYLAVVDTTNSSSNVKAKDFARRLEGALRGNFPGAEWGGIESGEIPCLKDTRDMSVAAVSNVPTEKSEKFVSQTIEKLLDGIVPGSRGEEYTLVLLATPTLDAEERKLRLEQLYTGLVPYASWQTDFTYTETGSTSSSATVGLNAGVSVGRQVGTNQSLASGESATDSTSQGVSETTGTSQTDTVSDSTSDTTSHTDGTSESDTTTAGVNVSGASVGGHLDTGHTHGTNSSDTLSKTVGQTVARAVGSSTAHAVSSTLGRAVTKSLTSTVGSFASQSLGGNFGVNFARTSTVTATIGKNEGIHQTHTNYSIKHALELLEQQMRRLEEGAALGLWEFAAYVLSEDPATANNVAHSYLALTQGEDSFISQASVNLWRGDLPGESAADTICSYLRDLRHPIFALSPDLAERQPNVLPYPSTVTATTTLTGKELARSLNFPRKSVAGLPVFECASFGRNVATFEEPEATGSIELGHVFHMHREEPTSVPLGLDSLAGHTFVTGSTGAGKSNAVYRILEQADKHDVGFLVIEPAKGEYKDAFGNDHDVSVFGTNPAYAPLLRLDPFSFPEGVHVLEHLDRLVEIFNVCWPMYAAMPAVLKDAVERSYEDCGWDLAKSTNPYGQGLYPSFADVACNVRKVIDSSEYDAENKGAYKGSLLTRINSLCNGINGTIFSSDEVPAQTLFDGKTIVDLSRVGSSETKALLMGVLVLKLQEWRMSQGIPANACLRHLTVLEEAHNLLRRTSLEQGQEGGNLAGKSVEMLSNAIAEMRTYGEGFVIADQAPGLLDPSAVRNTNTKIVLRLPEGSDRELVGGAEALNEVQVKELARLPRGVAAVYQNNWIEAVLCKVSKARHGGDTYEYQPEEGAKQPRDMETALDIVSLLSSGEAVADEARLVEVRDDMRSLGVSSSIQVAALRILKDPPPEPRMTRIAPIVSSFFPEAREAMVAAKEKSGVPREWSLAVRQSVSELGFEGARPQLMRIITQGIVYDYLCNELHDRESFDGWYRNGVIA
ncbi:MULTISPECIES: helicase HerA domain-containing protein [Atopobiaceae]|uniref:DNA helicase HerA, contains HAS-barrel and ATPase domains n=1 Tax=Parafannyhessea umbonata TaxID=604330 RepID=A0A1H6HTW3_9ACTN|nr:MULTISPECIES: DUF87 domain-containing protein [Atopobiaceae]SEH39387.1 DNA helicase HerA, contains HAS-barrel and ATPase domains [Parafannyhessea umbonata]SJZ43102.1 DNA helicase HerA, contains HAS-barrel and ATPase domains [Olsenella sp. KH1P3]